MFSLVGSTLHRLHLLSFKFGCPRRMGEDGEGGEGRGGKRCYKRIDEGRRLDVFVDKMKSRGRKEGETREKK